MVVIIYVDDDDDVDYDYDDDYDNSILIGWRGEFDRSLFIQTIEIWVTWCGRIELIVRLVLPIQSIFPIWCFAHKPICTLIVNVFPISCP